jgi:dGTP triphosphohydrolase
MSSLLNRDFELFYKRDRLSKIDIYKIQKVYGCDLIKLPHIEYYNETTSYLIEDINERFHIEAAFEQVDTLLVEEYLNKSNSFCGRNHFWPIDYPLVTDKNELYKLVCQEKKKLSATCQFSLECLDEEAICVRFLFKKHGFCFKYEDNDDINEFGQDINDGAFKTGSFFKRTKDYMKKKLKSGTKKVKEWSATAKDALSENYKNIKEQASIESSILKDKMKEQKDILVEAVKTNYDLIKEKTTNFLKKIFS